ncbi:hypothetical protein ACA910_003136 [Epithemia clementina (nom. ined.)]
MRQTAATTTKRNGGNDKKVRGRKAPCSRRVTFQDSNERHEELVQWRKEQQEFRLILVQRELLERESQEQSIRQHPARHRLVGLFIVLFLAIVPLMSDHDPQISNASNSSSTRTEFFSNDTTISPNSGNSGGAVSSDTGTLVVSVSHVDYNILPPPKTLLLQFRESTIAHHGGSKAGDSAPVACTASMQKLEQQQFRIIESHPQWTLQQQQQHDQNGNGAQVSPSFFVVSIVRHISEENEDERPIRDPLLFSANVSVVAVALLDETSSSISRNNRNQPLDFIQVDDQQQTTPSEGKVSFADNSTLQVSYHAQLLSYSPCLTLSHVAKPPRDVSSFSSTSYSASLDSLPSFRELPVPPFPILLDNETKVVFFGWDETYNEMRLSRMPFDTAKVQVSQSNRQKTSSFQSMQKRFPLNDKQESMAANSTPISLELTLDRVPLFLEQLKQQHGKTLLSKNTEVEFSPNDHPTILVVGSSVLDVLSFQEAIAKKSNVTSGSSSHDRTSRRLETDDNSQQTFESELDSLEEKGGEQQKEQAFDQKNEALQELRGEERDRGPSKNGDHVPFEDNSHLLACHQLIHDLQRMYPQVTLVWRLPLYVPGIPRHLWQAEVGLMRFENIQTWDLYSLSFIGWAISQQRGDRGNQDLASIDYGSRFYNQVALAVRLSQTT